MAFSQSNYGIVTKHGNCFFFSYLLVGHAVEELQAAAYGSVFDTITTSTFKGYRLKLPEIDRIKEFEITVTVFFDKILFNTKQISSLTNLRNNLLPKLMSGEVRVKMS
jgi:type I restriction enzyme S subunit